MVSKPLQTVLDDLKIEFDASEIEPQLLFMWFKQRNVLQRNEIDLIKNEKTTTGQIALFCDLLKSKFDEVLKEIQEMASYYQWNKVLKSVQLKLIELNFSSLLLDLKSNPNATSLYQCSTNVDKIKSNLKSYLLDDVEIIFKYWAQLGVSRVGYWENFYNSDIIITDEFNNTLNIDGFEGLFENQRFKRVVIYAPAGYGKSSFVHEMVREWVIDKDWTRKFPLVFLFRLGEIRQTNKCSKSDPLTLKGLLERCLTEHNCKLFMECIEDKDRFESLLVFDGYDELQSDLLSDEVLDVILGRSKFKPYVVVTSRPDRSFEELKRSFNVCVQLKGFTESGVYHQLKKFGDACTLASELPYEVTKVPLFNTLLGLLYDKENISKNNLLSLIDNFVKYLIGRYRQQNATFSHKKEKKLMYLLGKAAQAQFNFMWCRDLSDSPTFYFKLLGIHHMYSHQLSQEYDFTNYVVDSCNNPVLLMPDFRFSNKNAYIFSVAKSAHLIMPTSSESEIYFPHKILAEYFAAFYWHKKCKSIFRINSYFSNIKEVGFGLVLFKNYFCSYETWFSSFLTYFDDDYKTALWKMFETLNEPLHIPLFNEYDNLPKIKLRAKSVNLTLVPVRMQSTVLKKMKIQDGCKKYNTHTERRIMRVLIPIKRTNSKRKSEQTYIVQ